MAIKSNITIDQGTDYNVVVDVVDSNNAAIDLTNYTANAQIRKHYSSTNAIAFSTSVSVANSSITLSLTANQTANVASGRYVYDLVIISGAGLKTRVIEGVATITPRVTR